MRFGFGAGDDIARWRTALQPLLTDLTFSPPRRPIGQLVKSMISGRTKDEVSAAAYERLQARFGSARRLAAAGPDAVLSLIEDVTFAPDKAVHLSQTLCRIERERPDFRLDFLATLPLRDALAWLERLPGMARKVAASTLNASTLARPVFIVDSHVHRVLQRLALVGEAAAPSQTSEMVTAAMPHWSGAEFLAFHVACKRLGQIYCRFDMPACAACPLARDYPARGGDTN